MSDYKFSTIPVKLPDHDCDVEIVFPSGHKVVVQVRPSNADIDYEGSLDFILPYDMAVTCWKGDDMEDAPELCAPHIRQAKQLVAEIPGDMLSTIIRRKQAGQDCTEDESAAIIGWFDNLEAANLPVPPDEVKELFPLEYQQWLEQKRQ